MRTLRCCSECKYKGFERKFYCIDEYRFELFSILMVYVAYGLIKHLHTNNFFSKKILQKIIEISCSHHWFNSHVRQILLDKVDIWGDVLFVWNVFKIDAKCKVYYSTFLICWDEFIYLTISKMCGKSTKGNVIIIKYYFVLSH